MFYSIYSDLFLLFFFFFFFFSFFFFLRNYIEANLPVTTAACNYSTAMTNCLACHSVVTRPFDCLLMATKRLRNQMEPGS